MSDRRRTPPPEPTEVAQLAGRLHEMADRIDVATVAEFAKPDVFAAGQRCADVLDDMLTAAGHERRRQGMTP